MKINANYFVISRGKDNLRFALNRSKPFRYALDRLKWHWLPRLGLSPSFPQTVDIEASLGCQLRCPQCSREQAIEKFAGGGNMKMDLYKKIIDECAAHHVYSIKLSWRGEPTVNPNLTEMVRYAKDKGIPDVAFLTNGGLMSDERIRALIEAGLDWISFSIDGMYEDYDRIRAPITFQDIVDTVKRFRAIRDEMGRSKPLMRIQTISGCLERSPEYFDFWEPLVDRISVIAEQPRNEPELIDHDPDYVCQSPFQRVFITWDGRVAPCHGDYHLHHDMGNLNFMSLQEVWRTEKFAQLRKDMWNRERLKYEACRLCADGCKSEPTTLKVGDREIPIIRYLTKPRPEAESEAAE